MENRVGVIGLGYIGLPFVGALAQVGYEVTGLDIDAARVTGLQRGGPPPIFEPGLGEALTRHARLIRFTTSYEELARECSSIFICVGTPVDASGNPDNSAIFACIRALAPGLRRGQLIALRSTVVPGTTRKAAKLLEELSGLTIEQDFDMSYCPERTIEGQALHELHTLPKIVGGVTRKGLTRTVEVLGKLGGRIIEVNSPEIAELCKLADNVYRAASISLANELAEVCERMGLDIDELTAANNADYTRTRLFKGGLGADGPCLTKDPLILRHWAHELQLDTPVLDGVVRKNATATLRPAVIAQEFAARHGIRQLKVALLGLAFKGFPETDDTRDSAAEKIIRHLSELTHTEFCFQDPVVTDFNGHVVGRDISGTVSDADAILLLSDHPSYRNLGLRSLLASTKRPLLIVDCWRVLDKNDLVAAVPTGVELFRLGERTP